MIITVPPVDTYNVPEGRYPATCVEAREYQKTEAGKPQTFLRIIWELKDSPDPSVRCLVGKNYPPSLAKGSDLRIDLENWLGRTINARQFDTETLHGTDAVVTVTLIHNEGHQQPYRWVSKVEPLADQDDRADREADRQILVDR